MSDENDQRLWDAVVSAEQRVAESRAEFFQQAVARPRVLAGALAGPTWAQRAALGFLRSLPDDVPDLLDELVEHALADRWALLARQAIAAGVRTGGEAVLSRIGRIVVDRLSTADAHGYRRLAEMAAELQAWEALADLVRRARQSADEEVREVADDFEERFGPMLSRRET